jgi:uncharacterized membrane protein
MATKYSVGNDFLIAGMVFFVTGAFFIILSVVSVYAVTSYYESWQGALTKFGAWVGVIGIMLCVTGLILNFFHSNNEKKN